MEQKLKEKFIHGIITHFAVVIFGMISVLFWNVLLFATCSMFLHACSTSFQPMEWRVGVLIDGRFRSKM